MGSGLACDRVERFECRLVWSAANLTAFTECCEPFDLLLADDTDWAIGWQASDQLANSVTHLQSEVGSRGCSQRPNVVCSHCVTRVRKVW
jgi:hypothetical protein